MLKYKSIKVYLEDWKLIKKLAVDEECTIPELVQKVLQNVQ